MTLLLEVPLPPLVPDELYVGRVEGRVLTLLFDVPLPPVVPDELYVGRLFGLELTELEVPRPPLYAGLPLIPELLRPYEEVYDLPE